MAATTYDPWKLADAIEARRRADRLTIREAAQQAGVPPTVYHRAARAQSNILAGNFVQLARFAHLIDW